MTIIIWIVLAAIISAAAPSGPPQIIEGCLVGVAAMRTCTSYIAETPEEGRVQ